MDDHKTPRPYNHTAFGILNPYGDVWTAEWFDDEEGARKHVTDFWKQTGFEKAKVDPSTFKVVPVQVTITALSTDGDSAG